LDMPPDYDWHRRERASIRRFRSARVIVEAEYAGCSSAGQNLRVCQT
jgi:hypothetical protein